MIMKTGGEPVQLSGRELEVLLCDPKVSFPRFGLAPVVAVTPPLNFFGSNIGSCGWLEPHNSGQFSLSKCQCKN